MSPASESRTQAAGCGPWHLRWVEGRGSWTRASRRLGSGHSHLGGRAALVWMALCGRAFLSGPHLPHKLLCSRSRGAARRVRGEAGGTEVRAAWWAGGASARRKPGLSGTQIGESASCGKIQAHPRPLVNNGSGPFHCPERRSFHFTNGFVSCCFR